MTKQSVIFGVAAGVAGILAIYLWFELRDLRSQTAELQEESQSDIPSSQPSSIGAQPAGPPPSAQATQEVPLTPSRAEPPVLPGKEFDRLLNEGPVAHQHAALQAESRDTDWAQAAEDHWQRRFAEKPEIGPPVVQCKTTRCETRFLIPGVDKAKAEEILNRPIERPVSAKQEGVKDSTLTFVGWTLDEQGGYTAGILFARYARSALPAN
jgi:hypothetical protein